MISERAIEETGHVAEPPVHHIHGAADDMIKPSNVIVGEKKTKEWKRDRR